MTAEAPRPGESPAGTTTRIRRTDWSDQVERVMFLGDVHGEVGWLKVAIREATQQQCQVIMQVGDFGYWEHNGWGKDFLDRASDMLVKADLPLVWIDGNHENHTVLRLNYGPGGNRYSPTPDGFWTIRPNLFYAPRGLTWGWHGRSFLALGGAYSIDKNRRRAGESWWPEETITDAEVQRAIGDGTFVDVMVTHDAPWGVRGVMGVETVGDKDSFPESEANRKQLRRVFDVRRPKLLVHGHYHHRNSTHFEGCQVEGLARDGSLLSLLPLDLSEVAS